MPAVLARFGMLAVVWMILDGIHPGGLLIGLPAAALGAWISGRFFPPAGIRIRSIAALRLVLRCLWDGLAAGGDVALRALRPSLPLDPGVISVPCALPSSWAREALCALSGTIPGSLPAGDTPQGAVILHCLDRTQPAAAQWDALEQRLGRALGGPDRA